MLFRVLLINCEIINSKSGLVSKIYWTAPPPLVALQRKHAFSLPSSNSHALLNRPSKMLWWNATMGQSLRVSHPAGPTLAACACSTTSASKACFTSLLAGKWSCRLSAKAGSTCHATGTYSRQRICRTKATPSTQAHSTELTLPPQQMQTIACLGMRLGALLAHACVCQDAVVFTHVAASCGIEQTPAQHVTHATSQPGLPCYQGRERPVEPLLPAHRGRTACSAQSCVPRGPCGTSQHA